MEVGAQCAISFHEASLSAGEFLLIVDHLGLELFAGFCRVGRHKLGHTKCVEARPDDVLIFKARNEGVPHGLLGIAIRLRVQRNCGAMLASFLLLLLLELLQERDASRVGFLFLSELVDDVGKFDKLADMLVLFVLTLRFLAQKCLSSFLQLRESPIHQILVPLVVSVAPSRVLVHSLCGHAVVYVRVSGPQVRAVLLHGCFHCRLYPRCQIYNCLPL